MSLINKLENYNNSEKTTLKGVTDSEATYEVIDNVLIIRTNTYDTIHINKEIGKQLICIITNELL